MDLSCLKNMRIMVTGHTGFKGSWMCKVLSVLGAEVIGYALEPAAGPNLFEIARISDVTASVAGDIRNLRFLSETLDRYQPEIVIHMAAQPIVREGYADPVYTYETNVMGTVNICEAVRHCKSVKSFVNVTTDKVYRNREWVWGYRENEELDGYDPYSNSKSCSELVTATYIRSYFEKTGLPASTCRAGNVLGGGDFGRDRIIPDCIRSAVSGQPINVRNPHSIRPYQHVLEPVCAYLMLAGMQYGSIKYAGEYNIGPDDSGCVTTGALVEKFVYSWGAGLVYQYAPESDQPHEANFLKLDCSKAKRLLGWFPKWDVSVAVDKTVEWTKCYLGGGDPGKCMKKQIEEYLGL